MIFDRSNLFSLDQAITADAASTDIIDIRIARDIGKGDAIPLLIQVTQSFNNLTSLAVLVQCDDDPAFPTPKTIVSQTKPLAALTAGTQFSIIAVPPGANKRYLRLFYDITGTAPSTGKITASIILDGAQSSGIPY
jgi:hypothetical protein